MKFVDSIPTSDATFSAKRSCFLLRGLSLLLCLAPTPSWAGDVEITAKAATDWMYHGTTETGGNPVAGLAFDWQLSEHSFVGLEAHQAEVESQPQRHRSVMIYAGTGRALSREWYGTISVSHREFPKSAREWDFTEFRLQLDHQNGWSITLEHSPNYYEHNTRSYAGELSYRRNLSNRFYTYASIGALELSGQQSSDYQYGQIGAGVRWGQVVLDLAYRANTEGDDGNFGQAALSDPRFVGTLSWRLR